MRYNTLDPEQVGQRIRELRIEAQATQRELAEKAGITFSYISRVENGDRIPSLSVLIMLADALDVPALYLLTGDRRGHCPLCERG